VVRCVPSAVQRPVVAAAAEVQPPVLGTDPIPSLPERANALEVPALVSCRWEVALSSWLETDSAVPETPEGPLVGGTSLVARC